MPAQIINIGNHSAIAADLRNEVLNGLSRPSGERELPSMLLYDERGLELYDEIITNVPEYYLYGAEEEILIRNAGNIVKFMQPNIGASDHVNVLDLGAGSLHKTSHLLRGLSRLVHTTSTHALITYYALDLEEDALTRSLQTLSQGAIGNELLGNVEAKGLCGTFSDGIAFVKNGGLTLLVNESDGRFNLHGRFINAETMVPGSPSPRSSAGSPVSQTEEDNSGYCLDTTTTSTTPEPSHSPLHILFLGSTISNFDPDDASSFMRSLPLRPGSGDTLLLGLDHNNEKELIEEAYNDRKGYNRRFVMNGLRAAGRALGAEDIFKEEQWDYVNYYNTVKSFLSPPLNKLTGIRQSNPKGCHRGFFTSKSQQVIMDVSSGQQFVFHENELLKIEKMYKYSDADAFSLFSNGNVRPVYRWTDTDSRYSVWLLERPAFIFPLLKSPFSCNRHGQLVRKTSMPANLSGQVVLPSVCNIYTN